MKSIITKIKQFKYTIVAALISSTVIVIGDSLLKYSNDIVKIAFILIGMIIITMIYDKTLEIDLVNQGYKRVVIKGIKLLTRCTEEELNKEGYKKVINKDNKIVYIKEI